MGQSWPGGQILDTPALNGISKLGYGHCRPIQKILTPMRVYRSCKSEEKQMLKNMVISPCGSIAYYYSIIKKQGGLLGEYCLYLECNLRVLSDLNLIWKGKWARVVKRAQLHEWDREKGWRRPASWLVVSDGLWHPQENLSASYLFQLNSKAAYLSKEECYTLLCMDFNQPWSECENFWARQKMWWNMDGSTNQSCALK